MLSTTLFSALSSALLLTQTTALPLRTHCRCSITSSDAITSPPSTYRDSLENPDTLVPITATPLDLCVALGPSLENLRLPNPALYESYVSETDRQETDAATSAQKPLSTTVLLRLAAQQGFQNPGAVLPGAPARERAQERIECRTEMGEGGEGGEAWSASLVSWVTLVVLQLVVALMVVACVAEGVMFGMRWMSARIPSPLVVLSIPGRLASLRLSGEERLLLAIPATERNDTRSPGIQKKLRAYASPGWKSQRYPYTEDEDDEGNRPVM
ncbi:hypothetical protein PSPO01_16507 [Paraphaeosphaeria sporulosa]